MGTNPPEIKPPVLPGWNPFLDDWDTYERRILKILNEYCAEVEREYQAGQVTPNFATIMGVLTPREEQILRMRLGIPNVKYPGCRQPMTLEAVAREFAVRKERIRQIQLRAMKKLADVQTGGIPDIVRPSENGS